MPGPEQQRGNGDGRGPRRFRNLGGRAFGSRMGMIGAAVAIGMFAICIGTLPWTLARTHAGGEGAAARSARLYESTNPGHAMLPPFWAPHARDELDRLNTVTEIAPAGARYWLGTDQLGRSVLARCLLGGAISLGIGFAAAAISVVIGTAYGTLAGWRGGRTDAALMRIVDVLYGLPYILLVVLLAVAVDGLVSNRVISSTDSGPGARGVFDRGLLNIITLLVAIGGVSWLTMARVIRGQVLSLKQQPFMEASRAIGVPIPRQFFRHLLPNLLGPIVVYATLTVPAAILSESFLSFLGIGVQEPLPSWGNLAAAGLGELNPVRIRWWLLLWPCLFIALTLLSLNFLGEGLRERLDPRRRPSNS